MDSLHALTVLTLLLFAVAAGCGGTGATVSYDTSANQTVFETPPLTVKQDLTGSSYGATPLRMQVRAECEGKGCTPQTAQLTFSADGSTEYTFSNRSVSITADDEEYNWNNEQSWRDSRDVQTRSALVLKVALPLSDLKQIAKASSLSGSVANMPVNLEGTQASLKDFVSKAENPAARTDGTS